MSSQSSIMPTSLTGLVLIPLRIFYILLIPFPWLGGTFALEQFDFTVWHVDAMLGVSLVSAAIVRAVSYRSIQITEGQGLMLLVGAMYLAMPAFFYWPDRRYLTIAMPILLAFAAPILVDRNRLLQSVALGLSATAAALLVYNFGYDAILDMVQAWQN